jgi:hypothetical protein
MNRLLFLLLTVGLLGGTCVAGYAADAPASRWELSPYRIGLLVAVEARGTLPPRLADELPAHLAAQGSAAAGGAWRVAPSIAASDLARTMLADIAKVATKDLPPEALAGDKVMLVAVSERSSGYRVAARELDVATGLWNSVVTGDVPQAGQVSAAALRAMLAAFAPLGRIESLEGGVARLKLRGGALIGAGRGQPLVAAGALFRPVLLACDRQGQLQPGSAQPIDWTLLVATSATPTDASCRIETGLAGDPIPAYHPRQLRWALGVTPLPGGTTRLRLVAAGADGAPLEGCEVLAAEGEASGGRLIGRSDSRGYVSVPAADSPIRTLIIRRGRQPLARVPLVPGLAAEVSLALPDDRQRLVIEATLAEIEDGLIDEIARREALVARAKAALEVSDAAAAEKLKQQLADLASVDPLIARLDQAERNLKDANPQAQSALKPKVDALRKGLAALAAEKPQARLEKTEEAGEQEPKPAEASPPKAAASPGKP